MEVLNDAVRRARGSMRPYYPRFSEAKYARRNDLIRAEMEKREIDYLVIYGNGSMRDHCQVNVRWVSNYSDFVYFSYVLFPREGDPTLLVTIPHHIPTARQISPIEDVRAGAADPGGAMAARVRELGTPARQVGIVGINAILPGRFLATTSPLGRRVCPAPLSRTPPTGLKPCGRSRAPRRLPTWSAEPSSPTSPTAPWRTPSGRAPLIWRFTTRHGAWCWRPGESIFSAIRLHPNVRPDDGLSLDLPIQQDYPKRELSHHRNQRELRGLLRPDHSNTVGGRGATV